MDCHVVLDHGDYVSVSTPFHWNCCIYFTWNGIFYQGDRAFGNLTFSVRHGKKKVFSICVGILLIAYGSGVVVGASSSFLICKIVSVIGHTTLALLFLLRAKSLNLDDDVATQSFYMFLWKVCDNNVVHHV
uniref:Uncharacterized protein n=1 Tax=Daucus carota subsp. sativus TaxID=79200 RepID=A0A175YMB9_DAUCS